MSASVNSTPVNENHEQAVQDFKPLNAVYDRYGGVIVEVSQPMDSTVFASILRASVAQWRHLGKKGVWIKLPIQHLNLVEAAVKEGFWYHHAEPNYLMLAYWIPEGAHTLPANASHQVGIGAFVMNEKRENQITMAAPAASPSASISFTCTIEELFIALEKLTSGSPLPSNVIDDNPYLYKPQNLPDDFWFFIGSKENIHVEHGFWKTKEDACEVFSNPEMIGWRTTLEYFEGQVPYEHKTDWVMQEFSTTRKRLCDDNEKMETSSLCRVFLVPSHEMQQKVPSAGIDTESRNYFTRPHVLDANSITRIGSSSNAEVNRHDETEVLAVAERVPVPEHQGDNLVEMEYFSGGQFDLFSGGDFLELQDLDRPASSSSSENSSAISISSDEYFDSMAFLQDLEDQQNDVGKKLNVSASNKSDELVRVPVTLGSVVEGSNAGRDGFLRTAGSVTILASGSKGLNNNVAKHAKGDKRSERPSSSSSSSSSESHSAAAGGRKRDGFGKKLRKKLCFMPFR